MPKIQGPKVLLLDIETAPIIAYVWGLWDNNVALNQIHTDWHLLSWSAKWLDDPPSKVMYQDQRKAPKIEDDKRILKGMWKLIDEADIIITQNGKSFDIKKLNARFVFHKMQPPSSFKHIDVYLIAKKHFGFTSNKLEYMTNKLCVKYKKLKHSKFPGFEMWEQCLNGNLSAWKEMERYNKYDVLALEELYTKLIPWDSSINFGIYSEEPELLCSCGSRDFFVNGYTLLNRGKYKRYKCKKCGKEIRGHLNEFNKKS